MSDAGTAVEAAEKIGVLRGELNGLSNRVGRVEEVAGEARDAALRTEAFVKAAFGSGPQPVIAKSQSATEPKTDSVVSKAVALAGKPIAIHALYLGVGVVALIVIAIWQSGRPASDFLPGIRGEQRSGIGPLDQHERHP
jgi:hypothetical protein